MELAPEPENSAFHFTVNYEIATIEILNGK